MTAHMPRGADMRLYGCPACGLVAQQAQQAWQAADASADASAPRCPRCHTRLHHRKPDSLQRTWACLLGAALLYLPANTLPIMTTTSVLGSDAHTLIGGIGELWQAGSWALALIVFVASIAVPIMKLLALALLAGTAQRRSRWHSLERTRLYRVIEAVGHWSMLDVFVVVVLVGMIRFGSFAGVQPEAGLLAFGAVVVLTITASASFDPRLLWPQAPADARGGVQVGPRIDA